MRVTVTRKLDSYDDDEGEAFVAFEGPKALENAQIYADVANGLDPRAFFEVEEQDDVPVFKAQTAVLVVRTLTTEISLEADRTISHAATNMVVAELSDGQVAHSLRQTSGPARDPYDAKAGRFRHVTLISKLVAAGGSDAFAELDRRHDWVLNEIRNNAAIRRFWLQRRPHDPIFMDVVTALASGEISDADLQAQDDERLVRQVYPTMSTAQGLAFRESLANRDPNIARDRDDWKHSMFGIHYGAGPDAIAAMTLSNSGPDHQTAEQRVAEYVAAHPETKAVVEAMIRRNGGTPPTS